MLRRIVYLVLCCLSLVTLAQPPKNTITAVAINHVPIAVTDLAAVKKVFSSLGFTIKEGRAHVGTTNCFVKFSDGTYLEFVQPLDSTQEIGRFYHDFLKTRPGGSELVIEVESADSVAHYLQRKQILFARDHNRVWKNVTPTQPGAGVFYTEYADKNWRDKPEYTTHVNNATGLGPVYYLAADQDDATRHFEKLGFTDAGPTTSLQAPVRAMTIGRSRLMILDAAEPGRMADFFASRGHTGICGLSITVSSLDVLEKRLRTLSKRGMLTLRKDDKLYALLQPYALFLEFSTPGTPQTHR
ncbi:VOC family protein [Dawidia soli]|uniref:VOC family protein n=1 Tax=Dawidia soli TaxID=2782352 RepID=A0AAP2D8E7_9BACT|nr:VOC family protein [Dawidia soli]MBT1685950.1 VOC family protein [Dawidia soli]